MSNTIYDSVGVDLRKAVAMLARGVSTRKIEDVRSLDALMACRLIPLNKIPGIRPIGIAEVLRRIIGKAVMMCVKNDLVDTNGNLQLCAGQKSGCEIAVHAAADLFERMKIMVYYKSMRRML